MAKTFEVSSYKTSSSEDSYAEIDLDKIRIPLPHAQAIATILLAILMFTICVWLLSIKRGRYFRRMVRNLFGYFNVPIGLALCVCVNQLFFSKLHIPTVQLPTSTGFILSELIQLPSTWLAPYNSSKFYSYSEHAKEHGLAALMAICLLPAIATETLLSGLTVGKAERRLRKPCLFSLDLLITTCVLPLISGVLGWPFLSPAAVRSNTHVIALTKWNTKTPPGIPHKIIGCVEQRLTGFTIGLLLALSVTVEASVFALVPMGALYGMFFYMGVMGLRDLIIVRRFCALLKRHKHWKDSEYLRHLPPSSLALFVSVQAVFILLLLSLNWITEFWRVGATSLVFPFVLILFALVREWILPRFQLLGPHLEQLDRLHKVYLPHPPKTCCLGCCSCLDPVCYAQTLEDHASQENYYNHPNPIKQIISTDHLSAHHHMPEQSTTSVRYLTSDQNSPVDCKVDLEHPNPNQTVSDYHLGRKLSCCSLGENDQLTRVGWTISSDMNRFGDYPRVWGQSESKSSMQDHCCCADTCRTGLLADSNDDDDNPEDVHVVGRTVSDGICGDDDDYIDNTSVHLSTSLDELSSSDLEGKMDNPYYLD